MTRRADELLEAVLLLSEEERLEVSERLYRSVAPPGDLDLGPEWAFEIARRIREYRDGTVKAIPWEEAQKTLWEGIDGAVEA